jgi:hypothetical protein
VPDVPSFDFLGLILGTPWVGDAVYGGELLLALMEIDDAGFDGLLSCCSLLCRCVLPSG